MEIQSLKRDAKIFKKEDYLKDDISVENNLCIDPNLNAAINLSINQIMINSDVSALENHFNFLISYLKKNDYIFPPEFIQKLLFFLTNDQNPQKNQNVLTLTRLITSFDSIMQQFLIDNSIFDILNIYFPNEEVIYAFSNLSCANSAARNHLLNSGIIDFIKSHINNSDLFPCLIQLSQNLLFYINNFSYDRYIAQFIQLFHMIISLINSDDIFSPVLIISAFRDYLDADYRFLDDFLNNNQLLVFLSLSLKINENDFLRPLLKIFQIIIYQKKENGAQYLINLDILRLISIIIYYENKEIRILCFNLIYCLVDFAPFIADKLIIEDYHTIAISEFNSDSPFRYRTFIYMFCCLLLTNSSPQYLGELIETGIIDLLVEYPSILKHKSDWILLLEGIYKLKDFLHIEIVKEQVEKIKSNEEFMEWIDEACDSQNQNVSQKAIDVVDSLLINVEAEEDF